MKTRKTFTAVAMAAAFFAIIALSLAPERARAQSAFDLPGSIRTVLVDAPRLISGNAANAVTSTVPVDIHLFTGKVKIDFILKTNTGNSDVLAANVQTSPDLVSWTSLQNYALLSRATAVIYTNLYYGTNGLTATNYYNLPGAIVTPTAATAGWATPYLDNSTPYTNTGAITMAGEGVYTIGFQADDQQRFLRVWYLPSGNATNNNVAAVMTGRTLGNNPP